MQVTLTESETRALIQKAIPKPPYQKQFSTSWFRRNNLRGCAQNLLCLLIFSSQSKKL